MSRNLNLLTKRNELLGNEQRHLLFDTLSTSGRERRITPIGCPLYRDPDRTLMRAQ